MSLPVLGGGGGREKKQGVGRQANEQDCSADWYLSLLNVCVNMHAQSYLLLTTDSEKHSALFCEEE